MSFVLYKFGTRTLNNDKIMNDQQKNTGLIVGIAMAVYLVLIWTTFLMKSTLDEENISFFSKFLMVAVWVGVHFCVFSGLYHLLRKLDDLG